MKNKFAFLLLLSLLFISQIFSQNRILTLDDAINIALENNRDIRLSKMTVEKAGAAVDEAFGYALPSLDLNGTFTHFLRKPKMPFPDFGALLKNATYSILFDENVIPRDNNKFVPVETQLQSFAQSNNYEAQLILTQTLFSSTVFRGIGASRIYYNLSKAEMNNTISKTVLSVQTTFFGVLLAKQIYEITNASFMNAQDNLRNVKALFNQGLVSEFDMLQAEVQVENIRPMVLQMENTLKTAKDGLKVLLGMSQEEEIDITGEFVYEPEALLTEYDLISEALQSNFGLKSLELKKQVDEAFIQIDVSEYWPNIAAFGSYSYAGSSDKWNFQNYSSLTVGLSFSINLWKGNRTKNRVEQSTITFKQTEEQMSLYKDFLITQVRSKYNELKRVQSLIDAQNKNVKVAERAYEIAKVRYKEGTGSQLEIQNADIALKQARTNYIQSIHSYLVTKFELDQLLGRTNQEYLSKYETE